MTPKLSAFANADGSAVDITIRQADGTTATMAVPVDQIGNLAWGLFRASIECASMTGKFADLTEVTEAPYVRHAHTVGLSPAEDGSGLLIMIFAIDGSDFAIGVPPEILKPLGESFKNTGGRRPALN